MRLIDADWLIAQAKIATVDMISDGYTTVKEGVTVSEIMGAFIKILEDTPGIEVTHE